MKRVSLLSVYVVVIKEGLTNWQGLSLSNLGQHQF
jgi:hypothetical protein